MTMKFVKDTTDDNISGKGGVTTTFDSTMDDEETQFADLSKIFNLLRPLCHNSKLICEMKRSNPNPGDFVKIHNPISDKFFPTLYLIIYISEGNLFLRLALDHRTIFKERVIKNINDQLSNPDDYLSIVSVLSAILSELRLNKYQLCQGAFDERNYQGDISDIDCKTVLIQNEHSKIVFRSRQCTFLVRESIQCKSCSLLYSVIKNNFEGTQEGFNKVETSCLETSCDMKRHGTPETDVGNEDFDKVKKVEINNHENIKSSYGEEDFGKEKLMVIKYQNPLKINYMEVINNKNKCKIRYKKLILKAIKESPNNMLRLSEIYDWILKRCPGITENKTLSTIQNEVRHTLSLNKVFYRFEDGQGHFWRINFDLLKKEEKKRNYTLDMSKEEQVIETRKGAILMPRVLLD